MGPAPGSSDRPPPRPAGDLVRELTFCVTDLPGVREFAAAQARRGGMTEDRVGDFLIAVNEVATNAVTHGGPKARLRLWHAAGLLIVETHDDGHWIPSTPPGRTPPSDYPTSGMGLWVSGLLSEDIHLDMGPSGTTVTMSFRV